MIEQLKWEPLFVMRLNVAYARAQRVGAAPGGNRGIFPVDGGTFEGPRMRGVVLPDGADWVTWRPDGTMIIDVRTSLQTDDGALIAMSYVGLATGRKEGAMDRFAKRESVPYEDIYARTTPRFETADPRYDWLNRVIAVANGFRSPEGPMYHVFEIT